MKTNLVAVRLTDGQSMTAFRLGGGNTSKGIQRALDAYRGRDIPARLRNAPTRPGSDPGYLCSALGAESCGTVRPADTPAETAD